MEEQKTKKEIRERMCIGCRKVQHKNNMIRVVRAPNGEISIDQNPKPSPGRGAYLCKNEKCLKLAQKKRQLEKVFKTKVPAEVYDRLNTMINAELR